MGKKEKPSDPDPAPTDERVRRSKEAVLAATHRLLSETGFSGVSVDAVSELSGVAKTTIYRHWPSRSALLLDACANLGSKLEVPDTGSLKGDVALLAGQMAERLRSRNFASVLPSIIDAAERDPVIAATYSRLLAGILTPLRSVIERAQERGALSRSVDPSDLVAAIVGPLFYRRWFSREPLDERFIKGVVERAVATSKPKP